MKTKPDGLEKLLADPRMDKLLGRAACARLSALACLMRGERDIGAKLARQFGISRQAAGKHVRRTCAAFGFPRPTETKG
jgi:hypothetical protein